MRWFSMAVLLLTLSLGCGGKEEAQEARKAPQLSEKAAESAAGFTAEEIIQDPGLVHARLQAANPGYKGTGTFAIDPSMGLVGEITDPAVSDLSGLKGIPFGTLDLRGLPISDLTPLQEMPLKALGLEQTLVQDLSSLKGMKLERLYLNHTGVTDLSPLKGMPLVELMMVQTRVKDLTSLQGAPLQMLWLNGTPVEKIDPIAGCPLISLTLEGTRVSDISSLSGHATLERLHIGETPVADLTPLDGLQLTRLIFTPGMIEKGVDVIRKMTSLQELGVTLEERMPPEKFWQLYY